MENLNENYNQFEETEGRSLKEYLRLIRNNLFLVLIIIAVSLAAAIFYAFNSRDIYSAETTLRISKPQGSILESPLMPEFQEWGNDRFLANEIEILKSSTLRKKVAQVLIDSFYESGNSKKFFVILKHDFSMNENQETVLPVKSIAKILSSEVDVEQKKGLDIITIKAESPAPYEAALIGNIYATEYKNFNLEINRDQLTFIKNFLSNQLNEKQAQLNEAEDTLRNFQEKGGVIALDEQATALIDQLSQFEAKENATKIE